jgi:hypothetical protein
MRTRSALLVTGVAIATSLLGASAASADPKGETFPVVCENGVIYEVTINGNGEFTPAHDSASNSILVPTAFGELHGTITDADGNVIDEFVDPAASKGSSDSQTRATTTACTFTITDSFDDPDLGPLTFTGVGSVTGFITPVR